MKCPECRKTLKQTEYTSEILDSFKIDSMLPETIILRVPKAIYYCNKCQIKIEKILPIISCRRQP